jgi:hypothetical protein
MSDEILKLKPNPYHAGCKPLEDELDGFWRIHVGRINNILYVAVYLVCEDCIGRDFGEKFDCLDCFRHAAFHIKLVSCGYRDDFYGNLKKNWQSWSLTAALVDGEQE